MINSYNELKDYLCSDFARYPKQRSPFIIRWLVKDEQTRIKYYIWVLRNTEYYMNKKSFTRYFWLFLFKRISNKLKIYINLNSCGKGLRLVHNGGGIYLNAISIGDNFTASTGVVIGKNKTNENRPIIGDNVNFSIGAKAYGRITIGNGTVITPNSVVIKSIPDDSIVSGVPGIIIKQKKYD